MAFATVEELDSYLDDSVDLERATLLLDLATARIVSYVGHPITQTTETITLNGTGTNLLLLPGRPVTAITSITLDGEPLSYTAGDYDYTWTEAGVVRRTGGASWGRLVQSIVVDYTHGYATVPDDIKAVCLQIAARSVHNPNGLRSESVGTYSYTVAATGEPIGLNIGDQEKEILDRYRLVLVG